MDDIIEQSDNNNKTELVDSVSSSLSSSASSYETSDTEDSDDEGPSKWQHWKKWEGPWYKKGKMDRTPIPRCGKKISLVSATSDEPIEISIEAIMNSTTLQNMLNDFSNETNTPIPIMNTSTDILIRVVKYLEYLYDFPKDEEWDINVKQEFSEWEETFIDVDHIILNDLCLTSNFLDIKPLLKLSCRGIAKILEKIPPEKMGKMCQELFGTANDIPEDEYKQMMEANEKYFGDQ